MLQRIGFLLLTGSLCLSCAKRFPGADLSAMDDKLLQACREGPGVVLVLDERYNDYWGGGYDTTSYLMLGQSAGGSLTAAPSLRMTVNHRVMKILSEHGARQASTFTVDHYREKAPPVEVRLWSPAGEAKKVNVQLVGTRPLVDWPCENGFPRRSTFRIGPLAVGDVVEIFSPASGPDQLLWRFGSPRYCVQRSRVVFGHADDEYRADMRALLVDASGGVRLTSPAGEYPLVFELQRPLPPLSADRIPFVQLCPRCPGWSHLRARILKTALWLARAGKVAGRKAVNPILLKPVAAGQKAQRIATVAAWLQQYIKVEESAPNYWYRWMPLEPVERTARRRRGSSGNWSALAFRILEEAGLAPRFALLHDHPRNPFQHDAPAASQFDVLAVVVADDEGKDHWLVPGITYDPSDQPPSRLRGKKALLVERWWLDREQGAGSCEPELELTFSCQIETPEPVELKLVSIGFEEQAPPPRGQELR